MNKEQALLGLTVRNSQGVLGCVAALSESSLKIQWLNESVLDSKYESVSISDRKRVSKIELLTLRDGWKPMSEAAAQLFTTARSASLMADLRSLLSEEAPIAEAGASMKSAAGAKRKSAERGAGKASTKATGKSLEKKAREKRRARIGGKAGGSGKHNPFKTKTHLGPGPRKGSNSQTHAWKCSCPSPYKCLCRSGKKKKVIRIKKDYKKAYNHEYKAWRSGQKF